MSTTITTTEHARVARFRREAARQGLRLIKSRTRNDRADDWQTFLLVDEATNTVEAGPGMSIDDVERALSGGVA